eukprot:scaffold19007_cov71-Phaeocystis_antarctica.AAC.13
MPTRAQRAQRVAWQATYVGQRHAASATTLRLRAPRTVSSTRLQHGAGGMGHTRRCCADRARAHAHGRSGRGTSGQAARRRLRERARAGLVAKLRPVRTVGKPRRASGRLLYQPAPEERLGPVSAAHLAVDACAGHQLAASAALNGCRAFVDAARPLPWVGHGSSGARASKPARPERPPCLQTPKSTIVRWRSCRLVARKGRRA